VSITTTHVARIVDARSIGHAGAIDTRRSIAHTDVARVERTARYGDFKIITLTREEMGDYTKATEKVKAAAGGAAIRLAVSGSKGRHNQTLLRLLGKGGAYVAYNGVKDVYADADTVDIPVSAAIFNFVTVSGFNLSQWSRDQAPSAKEVAVAEACRLISQRSAAKAVQSFKQADFAAALNAFEQSAAPTVLTL